MSAADMLDGDPLATARGCVNGLAIMFAAAMIVALIVVAWP